MDNKMTIKTLFILIVWIVISDIIILFPFLFGNVNYLFKGWGYDTFHSYVPAIKFFCNKFLEHNFDLISLQIGLGSEIISFQTLLTDPIIMIIYLIVYITKNSNKLSFLMILVPLFASVFGGIFCFLYLRRYNLSLKGLLVGSYIYALCGYTFSTGTHYFFAAYIVVFPLLLFSIDLLLHDSKGLPFLLTVFLIAFQGPYGAYPIFLSAVLYIFFKLVFFIKKNIIKKLFHCFLTGLSGLLMSAIIFVPSLYKITVLSGRASGGLSFGDKVLNYFRSYSVLISKDTAVTAFLRLFSNNLQGGVDEWNGFPQIWFSAFPYFFSILFVFLLCQYIVMIFRKKRGFFVHRFVFCFCILALSTNVLPGIYNLFEYNQWRMIFVFLPYFAYICAREIDEIIYNNNFSVWTNWTCCIVTVVLLVALKIKEVVTNEKIYSVCLFFVVAFPLCLTILRYLGLNKKQIPQNIVFVILLILLMTNYSIDHRYSVYNGATPVEKANDDVLYIDSDLQQCISYLDADKFTRIEKTFLKMGADADWALIMPCRSASTYDSTLNQRTKDYLTQMVGYGQQNYSAIQVLYAINDYGSRFDASRAAAIGVKYVVSDQKMNLKDWKAVQKINNYYLYENQTIKTAGILYDNENWISEEQYEKLNMKEKTAVEPQILVLEKENINKKANELLEYEQEALSVECEQDLRCKDEEVIITPQGLGKVILPDNISDCKGVRRAINIEMESNGLINVELGKIKNDQEIIYKKYSLPGGISQINYLMEEENEEIFIRNIGEENISVKASLVKTPIKYSGDVELYNVNMGGTISGKVILDSSKILYLPVSYSDSWHAIIDGKETPIMCANYGFMAIEIPAGEHEILFEYDYFIYKVSGYVSLGGLIMSVLYSIFMVLNKKAKAS